MSELITVDFVGIKCAILVNQSIITSIISLPFVEVGNGPKKSISIDSHGVLGIGNGCSLPISNCVDVFVFAGMHRIF